MSQQVLSVPPATASAARAAAPAETRNLKVVAALIVSMTVGGGLLLWLEAPRPGWSRGALLAAERGEPIADLTIELLPADAVDLAAYDCVLLPDGECRWQPQGSSIRTAIVSSGGAALADAQVRKLLELLGSLSQARGLDLGRARLDSNSDPRVVGHISPEADDLLALLLRKGIVQ